jgi:hypothetical protein
MNKIGDPAARARRSSANPEHIAVLRHVTDG